MATKENFRLGASVNLKNPIDENTALHYAASAHNLDGIRLTLRSGGDQKLENREVRHENFSFCRNEKDFF